MDYANNYLYYILLSFISSIVTWAITTIGASICLFFKKISESLMNKLLAISAGIMLAATFWSLLNPAINMANNLNMISWLVVSIGILIGIFILMFGDKVFNNYLKRKKVNNASSIRRSLLLVFSITLHNIPEGMAIGVAFGSIIYGLDGSTVASAIALSIGIGIQNLPEGAAVSLPLLKEGYSKKKAFFYGLMSGIVEPISAVIGALLVLKIRLLLPFFLSLAAGAMLFVIISELIPTSQNSKKKDNITLFTILGFIIMMILDVALG